MDKSLAPDSPAHLEQQQSVNQLRQVYGTHVCDASKIITDTQVNEDKTPINDCLGHPNGSVPHFSGPSLDRKPGPYNIFVAAAQLDLDCGGSWMIGDRETDVACALAAGLRPILVTPHDGGQDRDAGRHSRCRPGPLC